MKTSLLVHYPPPPPSLFVKFPNQLEPWCSAGIYSKICMCSTSIGLWKHMTKQPQNILFLSLNIRYFQLLDWFLGPAFFPLIVCWVAFWSPSTLSAPSAYFICRNHYYITWGLVIYRAHTSWECQNSRNKYIFQGHPSKVRPL